MLTSQQIAWAKSHDWFYATRPDGKIVVLDRYSQEHPDGSITEHEDAIVWDKSFSSLRNWAGY